MDSFIHILFFFFAQNKGNNKNWSSCRLLSRGNWFGDSVLDDSPREATATTRGQCKLLRVEQRDFRSLWQVCTVRLLQLTTFT